MISWEEISRRVDDEIKMGTKVPKIDGKTRVVTKKVNSKIYMRTGVQTTYEKYTTKEILRYSFEAIQAGEAFNSRGLRLKFPQEYSQGSCVFSMTGGILELLGIAKYVRGKGYISK